MGYLSVWNEARYWSAVTYGRRVHLEGETEQTLFCGRYRGHDNDMQMGYNDGTLGVDGSMHKLCLQNLPTAVGKFSRKEIAVVAAVSAAEIAADTMGK